jgi:hypothetical protein
MKSTKEPTSLDLAILLMMPASIVIIWAVSVLLAGEVGPIPVPGG